MNTPKPYRRAASTRAVPPALSILITLALSLGGLAGCKDASQPAGAGAPQSATSAPAQTQAQAPAQTPAANGATAVSTEAIAAQAKGFVAGQAMSARTVYVFFDPQCPHCAALWDAAKPLKAQAKFVWIPVGLLNGNSATQGAALLAAPDGAAAMDMHEASMQARTGGIQPTGDMAGARAAVAANTKLFDSFGFNSVPVIVGTHAQSGGLVVKEGALPTADLAAALGLQGP